MHVGLEGERESLTFARRNNDAILLAGQVAHDTGTRWVVIRSPETSSDELNRYCLGFLIANGQLDVCWLAIHDLDSEYLSIRELSIHLDIQDRACGGVFEFLIDIL